MYGGKSLGACAGSFMRIIRVSTFWRDTGTVNFGSNDFSIVDHIYAGHSTGRHGRQWPKFLRPLTTFASQHLPPPLPPAQRQIVLADVSFLFVATVTAGLWLRVAATIDPHAARNSAADALAERFANPASKSGDPSGGIDDQTQPPSSEGEARFDFAPGLSLGLPPIGQPDFASQGSETHQALGSPGSAKSRRTAESDPLSVLIVRNLPPKASFSAGARVAGHAWVLAAADLDKLVLTLPAGLERPVKAEIETIAGDGVPAGKMTVELRAEVKPAIAMKRPAEVAHVKSAKHKSARRKAAKRIETARAPQKRAAQHVQSAAAVAKPQLASTTTNGSQEVAPASPGVLSQILSTLGVIPKAPAPAALAPEGQK